MMPSSDSAPAIRRALLSWYDREARDLPWRRTRDPYAIWLSEVILQQTRIDQGTPYYERFIAAFPTVKHLADAHEDAVLKLWEGLGYYSRARNLHKAAKLIAYDRNGAFPGSAEAWLTVPGVGRYTAGAIASIAFGERTPVLDGNVIRVLTRLDDINAAVDDAVVKESLWTRATGLVPAKRPGDFNQALMELGARVCTPKAPACGVCPVARWCAARQQGTQEQRPVRKAKKATPHREMVAAVIQRDGRYLIGRRPAQGLLGGLWEFPGGDVQSGESHEQAVRRIARALAGVAVRPGGLIASVDHAYSHFRVTVNAYACRMTEGDPAPVFHTAFEWVEPASLSQYAFPKTNIKFLHLITGR